jgi:hypothetical protein
LRSAQMRDVSADGAAATRQSYRTWHEGTAAREVARLPLQ